MKHRTMYESSKDGFVDFKFDITAFQKKDKQYNVMIKGEYGDETAGLSLEIVNEGFSDFETISEKEEKIYINIPSYYINIISIGDMSDIFFKALCKAYNITLDKYKMANKVSLNCIAVEGSIDNIENEEIKIKCFFEYEQAYAEIYINIDKRKKYLEISEKDQNYRKNIIKSTSYYQI